MLDIDALLHAVLNDPADDVARLVYADRLDETGVPMNAVRAEFIRLQIADADHDRQKELAAEWLADWFGKPVEYAGRGGRRWEIGPADEMASILIVLSRGFISEVGTYGVHTGEWNDWAHWRYAEAFANTVVDVFTDHPVEWIRIGYGAGEEWRIGRSRESAWAAYRYDGNVMQALCESVVSRTAFAKDLGGALTRHVAELVYPILYELSLEQRFAP